MHQSYHQPSCPEITDASGGTEYQQSQGSQVSQHSQPRKHSVNAGSSGISGNRSNHQPIGRRHIWSLARRLKAQRDLSDASFGALVPLVRQEFPRASDSEVEVIVIELADAMDRVIYPDGSGPVDDAFRAAISKPPPSVAEGYTLRCMRNLIALCHELSERCAGSFVLDQRTAERLLGVPQPSVSRLLARLRKDRVIKRVEEPGPGRAAEYCWVAGQVHP